MFHSFRLYKLVLDGHMYFAKSEDSDDGLDDVLEEAHKLIQNHPEILTTKVELRSFRNIDHPNREGMKLLEMEFNQGSRNNTTSFPISWVCVLGVLPMVKLFAKYAPESISLSSNATLKLPLHFAVKYGHQDVTKFIIELHPDAVRVANRNGLLPLHFSVLRGHEELSKFLIEKCPDTIRIKDNRQNLPFHYAVRGKGNIEMSKILYEMYPEAVTMTESNGQLPLHIVAAANNGNAEITKYLLEKYPDAVSVPDCTGSNALHIAVINHHEAMSRLLIEVDPTILSVRNNHGLLPFHPFHCIPNNSSMVKLFFDKALQYEVFGPDSVGGLFQPTRSVRFHTRPLWKTRETTWSIIYRRFRDKSGITKMFHSAKGCPILHAAIGTVPLDEIQFIIDRFNVDLNKVDSQGRTALIVVIEKYAEYIDNSKYWNEYYKIIIEMILSEKRVDKISPAQILDTTCRYPLFAALEHGLPWSGGVEKILSANISALDVQDQYTGLFPFMLGACSEFNESPLTVIYEVLRYKPDIMEIIMN